MAPHLGGLLESFTELSLDQSVSSCGVLSMTPNWVDVADSRVECATCRVNDGFVPQQWLRKGKLVIISLLRGCCLQNDQFQHGKLCWT